MFFYLVVNFFSNYKNIRSSPCSSVVMSLTSIREDTGLIPGPAQWVRIKYCCKLWCRSQMWLGSGVAVVVVSASSCSSNLTPGLGTSICCMCSPKKQKKKKIYVCLCVCVWYSSRNHDFSDFKINIKSYYIKYTPNGIALSGRHQNTNAKIYGYCKSKFIDFWVKVYINL